jgi:hypothetical protein
MGLRFWKRVKILPGVTINLSRGIPSVSIGPRGAKLTIGAGGTHATVGLPGTGLFYTEKLDKKKPPESRKKQIEPAAKRIDAAPDTLVGVLDAACDLVDAGKDAEALARLESRPAKLRHADLSFLSGLLVPASGRRGDCGERARNGRGVAGHGGALRRDRHRPRSEAADHRGSRGRDPAGSQGALLAWVEALQRLGRIEEARAALRAALAKEPGDELLTLSLEDLD